MKMEIGEEEDEEGKKRRRRGKVLGSVFPRDRPLRVRILTWRRGSASFCCDAGAEALSLALPRMGRGRGVCPRVPRHCSFFSYRRSRFCLPRACLFLDQASTGRLVELRSVGQKKNSFLNQIWCLVWVVRAPFFLFEFQKISGRMLYLCHKMLNLKQTVFLE